MAVNLDKPEKPIKVDKGVPYPGDPQAARSSRYPFAAMKAGDSFLVPYEKDKPAVVAKRVMRAAWSYKNRTKIKARFSTKRLKEGVRCWRLS